MQISIQSPRENSVNLMRRVGYVFQKQVSDQEIAFIRSLGTSGFPRFHVYMKKIGNDFFLNIHLDQHKETYGKDTAHHGEYDPASTALSREIERIQSILLC